MDKKWWFLKPHLIHQTELLPGLCRGPRWGSCAHQAICCDTGLGIGPRPVSRDRLLQQRALLKQLFHAQSQCDAQRERLKYRSETFDNCTLGTYGFLSVAVTVLVFLNFENGMRKVISRHWKCRNITTGATDCICIFCSPQKRPSEEINDVIQISQ